MCFLVRMASAVGLQTDEVTLAREGTHQAEIGLVVRRNSRQVPTASRVNVNNYNYSKQIALDRQ